MQTQQRTLLSAMLSYLFIITFLCYLDLIVLRLKY